MVLHFNKKTNDELKAITTFINESKGIVNEKELIDFIYEYEYFYTYYKNFHIFRAMINYHNLHYMDDLMGEESKEDIKISEW